MPSMPAAVRRFICIAVALCALFSAARAAESVAVVLAEGGKALLPVVVKEGAAPDVKAAAQTLAATLQRFTGATFAVTAGDGTRGLAVGLPGDFPAVAAPAFEPAIPRKREEYWLHSHANGVQLIGATPLAVRHAVWDLLYRLGYRQFFPNPTWEVVPSIPTLRAAVDVFESPDYYARRIWYQYGSGFNDVEYNDWCTKNRALAGIVLNTGHSYEAIIRANQQAFDAHPEYFALVNGQRKPTKFCIANAGLRTLVVQYCLRQFAANPALDSVSLDPSDGGGWCECDACKAMGTVSDRVVTLANEAAAAVQQQFPGKLIGIYAYHQHSPPPRVRVHPNVVVSVATAFITGGFTMEQLLDGWAAQGAELGIRDYYSVNVWSRDLPGSATGTNLRALQQRIPYHYAKGARFLSSESTDSWGPCGPGYYFAARMLWDVKEAVRKDEILADFYTRCFGPAQEPVKAFYTHIDGGNAPLLSDDLIGRMYRDLRDARALTQDPAILARLDALVLYTRYVELFFAYSNARGEARQQAFEQVMRFSYRIRKTGMVSTLAFWRDLPNRDKSVTVPEGCAWNVAEEKNPWKQNPPVTREEIDTLITQGIEHNALCGFTPVAFSTNLVPATPLGLPPVKDSMAALTTRFELPIYTWVPDGAGRITLSFSGNGRILTLEAAASAVLEPVATLDLRAKMGVTADKPEVVTLETPFAGLHTLTAGGTKDGSITLRMGDGLPMTVPASAGFAGRWYLYFYVPKGTTVVGGYSESATGKMLDAAGRDVFSFEAMGRPGYFSVPVPAGQDGALWRIHFAAGAKRLMTVPPYYARNAAELLLPAEVVAADRK